MGRNLVELLISGNQKRTVNEMLQKAMRGDETTDFDMTLHARDMSRIEVLLSMGTRRDKDGNIVGVMAVGQDITERKKAEGELERVAQDLRALIDTANAPIFGIDKDGNVNKWNNKAAEITEYAQTEVMGRNLVDDFITSEYKVAVKAVLDAALQGKETANFEFPLFTKNQDRVEVLLNATTRRDEQGNIVGVVGVGQDITERKKAEGELERVAQDLQRTAHDLRALVKALVTAGANPDHADHRGWTALHVAAKVGHVETIRALVEAGADLNCADRSGKTPLYVAAAHGRVEAINVLLVAGASKYRASTAGFTPLAAARGAGHEDAAQALLQAAATTTAGISSVFQAAVHAGNQGW